MEQSFGLFPDKGCKDMDQEQKRTVSSRGAHEDDVAQIVSSRIVFFSHKRTHLERLFNRIVHLRLVLFLMILFCLANVFFSESAQFIWGMIALGAFFAFIIVIVVHQRIFTTLTRAREMEAINREAQARLIRDWNALPRPDEPGFDHRHSLSEDLDLKGKASLYHLLCTANTPAGRSILADWLQTPASPPEIQSRQHIVQELASEYEFLQELEFQGRQLARDPADIGPFLSWCESSPWLLKKNWLVWLTRLLVILLFVLLLLNVIGIVLTPLWLLPVALNLVLTGICAHKVHLLFSRIKLGDRSLYHYARMFAFLDPIIFHSERWLDLKKRMSAGNLSAYKQLRRLARLVSFSHLRYSELLYLPIQALTLWDFHVLLALEKWQKDAGHYLRSWLLALGELESLACLARLKFENPSWSFPQVTQDHGTCVIAENLGHPLLPPRICVRNNVTVGPPGSFLLVTGSNMSGKSTLLRTLGVNIILAQAGAPVCAQALSIPPLVLGTSFRIRDSLSDGVSYFMAELKQIKDIVERARSCYNKNDATFFFLLDEILLGTNVAERQLAVQQVLLHLIRSGAIGAIATHDLSLAEAPGLETTCSPVHFSEHFSVDEKEEPRLLFDYRLHHGLAQTTNALKLLHIVGLNN
ncbi:hypothetical protein JXQ70_09825 [bacterium]|nr:hypothetical protein [bacterium]